MNTYEPIQLFLGDEADRLSELTELPWNVSYAFVLAEDKFCDMKGLNDYGEADYVLPEDTAIDVPEMIEFISKFTAITMSDCYRLEDAERKYFSEIGIIERSDYEGEFADA